MANPWDSYSFPLEADDDENQTFQAVGRLMTIWESIEFEFAMLYSIFVGGTFEENSVQEYGKPRIAKERFDALSKVAAAHFVQIPNQAAEGEFCTLVTAASGFSVRRNEVAHDIVVAVQNMVFFQQKVQFLDRTKNQFLLVPALHSVRQFDGITGMPSFGYNSEQIANLCLRLLVLMESISAFRQSYRP